MGSFSHDQKHPTSKLFSISNFHMMRKKDHMKVFSKESFEERMSLHKFTQKNIKPF